MVSPHNFKPYSLFLSFPHFLPSLWSHLRILLFISLPNWKWSENNFLGFPQSNLPTSLHQWPQTLTSSSHHGCTVYGQTSYLCTGSHPLSVTQGYLSLTQIALSVFFLSFSTLWFSSGCKHGTRYLIWKKNYPLSSISLITASQRGKFPEWYFYTHYGKNGTFFQHQFLFLRSQAAMFPNLPVVCLEINDPVLEMQSVSKSDVTHLIYGD